MDYNYIFLDKSADVRVHFMQSSLEQIFKKRPKIDLFKMIDFS